MIDGSIGELSPFHGTFGYYAHGVGPETAALPAEWRSRLVRVENENTAGRVGWCLSPVDLAVSKLLAGREKDFEFIKVMLQAGLTSEVTIQNVRIELTAEQAALVTNRMSRICGR